MILFNRFNLRRLTVFIFLVFFLMIPVAPVISQEAFISNSLHYTTEGMRYWYEEHNGFKDITGIPYSELDCKNCHVQSCDKCHSEKKNDVFSYTVAKAKNQETCLDCHSREGATIRFGEKLNMLDVHFANKMACADCHKSKDVHGDGKFYHSMRDTNAVRTACTDCHEADTKLRAHTVHKGKLDCNACHVKYTTTCMNCHFDRFLETGQRKGNFIGLPANVFLINYKGKVTSANLQTLVYKGEKFVAYAPYFTHSVTAKARECTECHGTEVAKQLKNGKRISPMEYADGKYNPQKCVIPIVADQLDWQFLDKQGDEWIVINNDKPVHVQNACYGEPLTKKQINKLAMPFNK